MYWHTGMTKTYCFGKKKKKKNQVSEQNVLQNLVFIKINLHMYAYTGTYMSVYAQKKVGKDAHQTAHWVTSKEVVWGRDFLHASVLLELLQTQNM